MNFAHGKIVLALEGGYNLESIANSMMACVKVLLEDKSITGSLKSYPFESTWHVIQAVRQELCTFWPSLASELPKTLTDLKSLIAPYDLASSSDSDLEGNASNAALENLDEVIQGVIEPLSKLNVNEDLVLTSSANWRSQLSKIDVWYATFGSNLWYPRFRCYIEGGQVEGMQRPCSGSVDKTQPKEILWKTFPHRLFFGRDYTTSWGPGGAAFLNPESNIKEKTYMCLYRITLEQLNDVLAQENTHSVFNSPSLDKAALSSVSSEEFNSLEVKVKGWYRNVLFLGKELDTPILTMTCTHSDIEGYKSGRIPLCAPSKNYAKVLVRGLVEGKQFSDDAATTYIQEASTRPL